MVPYGGIESKRAERGDRGNSGVGSQARCGFQEGRCVLSEDDAVFRSSARDSVVVAAVRRIRTGESAASVIGSLAIAVLFVASPLASRAAAPGDTTRSAPGASPATPMVTRWTDVAARDTRRPAAPPEEEVPEWWERLSPEDRRYIAPGEYEDPLAILAVKKRHALFAKAVREALAQDKIPPAPWQPFDPSIAHPVVPLPSPPPPGFLEGLAGPDPASYASACPPAPESEEKGPAAFLPAAAQSQPGPDAPGLYATWSGPTDSWRPSDSVVAVGPAHVGAVVNSTLAFYTKDGVAAVGPVSLSSWFSGAPLGADLFDPKILYDRFAGHWIILVLNGRGTSSENYYALSVSQTSDPEGAWWTWYLRSDIDGTTDTNFWTDYPGLGVDSGDATASAATGGAVYITSNQYVRGGGFDHGKLRVLYKNQLYTGAGSVGWWDFWNASVFAWKPAATDSSTGASPTEYLANTLSSGGTSLTVWALTNPLNTSTGPTLNSYGVSTSLYGVPPNADQLGGGKIDTGDCRTQDVQYRNGFLFLAANDYSFWGGSTTYPVAHYWKIDAATHLPAWDAYFGANTEAFFYPKIQVDPSSNAHVVFSQSNATSYVRVGVTGILAADGLVQSYNIVGTGSATYLYPGDSVQRWGDYSGMGFDCAGDQNGAWAMAQVATATASWTARIGGSSFGAPNVYHLADGASLFASTAPRWFTWKLLANKWSGIALYNALGGDNDLAASSTCPFGTAYATSTFGTDIRDFILANGAQWGGGYHHARVDFYAGAAGYRVEARGNSTDVPVASTSYAAFGSAQILQLFQTPLVSGKRYAAVVDVLDGNANLDLWVFRGSHASGTRSLNDGSSRGTGTGATGDETLLLTASESSTYGFAVTNENFGASNYAFRVWLAPAVAAVSNATIPGGGAYTGPTPSLAEGTTPVTWSLDSGPAGMTINAATGVVSWPGQVTGGVYTITIRATNPAGYSTTSWTLTVVGAPGRTPDGAAVPGTPLAMRKNAAVPTSLILTWGASCNASATDEAVYIGTLGSWYSHAPLNCTTGGTHTATIAPPSGNRYFLIVPTVSAYEGGYGTAVPGGEIPRAGSPCVATQNLAACP